jgi:hypothetical protein
MSLPEMTTPEQRQACKQAMTPAQHKAYEQAVEQLGTDLLHLVRFIVEHEHDPATCVFDTDMEGGWETVASAGRLETDEDAKALVEVAGWVLWSTEQHPWEYGAVRWAAWRIHAGLGAVLAGRVPGSQ